MPRFVVVMPNYNCSSFIGEAIESALNQSFDDYAIVVSDNDSTDGSQEEISRFSHPRLHVHLHKERLGKTANWNRAFALAPDCQYLVNLHTDDRLAVDCLSTIHRKLGDRQPVLVYGGIKHLSYDGKSYGKKSIFPLAHQSKGEVQKEILLLSNPVNVVGVAIERSTFQRLGGWPDGYNFVQDLELWLQLADEGISEYIPAYFGDYRAHGPNVSPLGQLMDGLEFFNEYVHRRDISPRLQRAAKFTLSKWYHRAMQLRAGVPADNERFFRLYAAAEETLSGNDTFRGDYRAKCLRLQASLVSFYS